MMMMMMEAYLRLTTRLPGSQQRQQLSLGVNNSSHGTIGHGRVKA